MNARAVRSGCVSAAACASMITAAGAWALVNATASMERDPFHFGSIMTENARAQGAQTVTVLGDPQASGFGRDVPDLLALPPPCLRTCA